MSVSANPVQSGQSLENADKPSSFANLCASGAEELLPCGPSSSSHASPWCSDARVAWQASWQGSRRVVADQVVVRDLESFAYVAPLSARSGKRSATGLCGTSGVLRWSKGRLEEGVTHATAESGIDFQQGADLLLGKSSYADVFSHADLCDRAHHCQQKRLV